MPLIRRRPLLTLLRRDLSEITGQVVAFTLLIMLLNAVLLKFGVVPRSVALARSNNFIGGMAGVALLQFVWTLISDEKKRGVFLFLRLLPVTNDEVMLSRVVAILIGVSVTYAVPIIVMALTLPDKPTRLPASILWEDAWIWILLCVLGEASSAVGLIFERRRGALVLIVAVFLFMGACYAARAWLPETFWRGDWPSIIEQWGLIPGFSLVYLGALITVGIYRRSDFVRLVE